MIAISLTVLLGQLSGLDGGTLDANTDGGTQLTVTSLPSYSQCPDAPLAVAVDGGFYLPELRAKRVACMLATCEENLKLKKDSSTFQTPWLWVGVGVVSGIAAGFLGGFIYSETRPKP